MREYSSIWSPALWGDALRISLYQLFVSRAPRSMQKHVDNVPFVRQGKRIVENGRANN